MGRVSCHAVALKKAPLALRLSAQSRGEEPGPSPAPAPAALPRLPPPERMLCTHEVTSSIPPVRIHGKSFGNKSSLPPLPRHAAPAAGRAAAAGSVFGNVPNSLLWLLTNAEGIILKSSHPALAATMVSGRVGGRVGGRADGRMGGWADAMAWPGGAMIGGGADGWQRLECMGGGGAGRKGGGRRLRQSARKVVRGAGCRSVLPAPLSRPHVLTEGTLP